VLLSGVPQGEALLWHGSVRPYAAAELPLSRSATHTVEKTRTAASAKPAAGSGGSAAGSSTISIASSTGTASGIAPIVEAGPFTQSEVSAAVAADIAPQTLTAAASTPAAAPFTPAEIRQFYGVESINFNGIAGSGAGETIGIVDAGSETGLVSSTAAGFASSDLHNFDTEFGLPDPVFSIYDASGGTNYPAAGSTTNQDESCLDVEWAHAIAPQANIVLIEIASLNTSNLYAGIAEAAKKANIVSISIGGSEYSGETSTDSQYFSASGVTYVASTGDSGSAGTAYPALSPNVVAVGGTSIVTSDSAGDYGSETVWNDASISNGATGGGPSSIEKRPSYQAATGGSGTTRTAPDVSFDADPQTGVYVLVDGSYYQIGGTSLACPCWAGLIAIADQGRTSIGLGNLTGLSQTLPRLYQLPSSDFHDITIGNNFYPSGSTVGYSATANYDLASGIGTPIASSLVPDLAGGANLTGSIYTVSGGAYSPIASSTVYLDINNRGAYNANDPTVTTSSTGVFSFTDLAGGLVGTVRPMTTPTSGTVVAVPFTTAYDTTTYADARPSDTVTAVASATAGQYQIQLNSAVVYTGVLANIGTLDIDLTGVADTAVFNFASGSAVPTYGAIVNGNAASNGDTLSVLGTSGNDTIVVNTAAVLFGASTITFASVPNLSINPGAGVDSLTVNANTVTMPAQTAGAGILTRSFSALAVGAGATLRQNNAAADSDRAVIVVASGGLSISSTGKLDLNANDMIVHGGNSAFTSLTSLLASGYAGGAWTGVGIASSAAAADASGATALGMVLNSVNGTALYSVFDGQTVITTDVLIKHTYYGDANLDGIVNGDDYALLDNGFNTGASGWINGDFNYDGKINVADYTLTDNAYNLQSATL
jgi:subtilase family serine protease